MTNPIENNMRTSTITMAITVSMAITVLAIATILTVQPTSAQAAEHEYELSESNLTVDFLADDVYVDTNINPNRVPTELIFNTADPIARKTKMRSVLVRGKDTSYFWYDHVAGNYLITDTDINNHFIKNRFNEVGSYTASTSVYCLGSTPNAPEDCQGIQGVKWNFDEYSELDTVMVDVAPQFQDENEEVSTIEVKMIFEDPQPRGASQFDVTLYTQGGAFIDQQVAQGDSQLTTLLFEGLEGSAEGYIIEVVKANGGVGAVQMRVSYDTTVKPVEEGESFPIPLEIDHIIGDMAASASSPAQSLKTISAYHMLEKAAHHMIMTAGDDYVLYCDRDARRATRYMYNAINILDDACGTNAACQNRQPTLMSELNEMLAEMSQSDPIEINNLSFESLTAKAQIAAGNYRSFCTVL